LPFSTVPNFTTSSLSRSRIFSYFLLGPILLGGSKLFPPPDGFAPTTGSPLFDLTLAPPFYVYFLVSGPCHRPACSRAPRLQLFTRYVPFLFFAMFGLFSRFPLAQSVVVPTPSFPFSNPQGCLYGPPSPAPSMSVDL